MNAMKVLCIDDDFSKEKVRPAFNYINLFPVQNKIYNVKFQHNDGYFLSELKEYFPNQKPILFKINRFIVVNEIDEDVNVNFLVEEFFKTVIFN